jgi:hypothetical protein
VYKSAAEFRIHSKIKFLTADILNVLSSNTLHSVFLAASNYSCYFR